MINAEEIVESVIGLRSRIDKGTRIYQSIVMGKDNYQDVATLRSHGEIPMGIGENCFIKNAIIDINCKIGNDVRIVGDISLEDVETDQYCIVDGIIVLKKGVVIPDGSQIGKVD